MTYPQAAPYAAGPGDHQNLEWLGGGIMQVLLDGEQTGGQLTMLRSSAPAGAASPVHVHANEDEIFVLLRGSAVFWVGEERHELGEGGVAFLPRGVPHAYLYTSDVDVLALATPSGLENFFRGAGRDVREPKPEGWSVTPQTMGQAAAANQQTILGRPLALHDTMDLAEPGPGVPAPAPTPYLADGGEHEELGWLGGGIVHILLAGPHTGDQLSVVRTRVPAGSASPVYRHSAEDEIILLLSGTGIFWIGDSRHELEAGGLVFVPRGTPMAYRVTTDAEFLGVTTPAGLEKFFRLAGWDLRQPVPEGWTVSPEALRKASAATGQSILGAPLGADEMINGDSSSTH